MTGLALNIHLPGEIFDNIRPHHHGNRHQLLRTGLRA